MNAPIDLTGVQLRTPRLLMRPWRMDDLEDFFAYASVDGVGQMAGWTPHRSLEDSRGVLEGFIREKKTFALEKDGRVIGSLGVERYDEARYPELDALSGREIGYVLSKEYWGQGLMPEAVRAVVDDLFGRVGLDFILVGHFDWNHQSARVIEKCGFAYIKTIPWRTAFDKEEASVESILYNPALGRRHI